MSATADTIAAIATATGGGLGILRLSGPEAHRIGAACFSTPFIETPRRLTFGAFIDPEDPTSPLDEGLAVAFHAPHSFTGEDIVELHLHGGALHLARGLDLLLSLGARLAEPGEFSRRAFLNGKLDLTRAEAIADLIAARTDLALRHARAHLQGALSRRVETSRDALLDLRAQLEVNLDFVDEDVPFYPPERLADTASAIAQSLRRLADTFHVARRMRDGAIVVLAGPPNAGKSSLFNALVEADRAIVTPIPGTTRDTLREFLDIRGIPIHLIDTAGLRDTEDPVERLGVARTLEAISQADLVVHLIPPELVLPDRDPDGASPPPDEVPGLEAPRHLFAFSKCDLITDRTAPTLPARFSIISNIERFPKIFVSATTGEGLESLREAIASALGDLPTDELVIVRERQYRALEAAAAAILRAADGLRSGLSPELPAVDLQDAMDELDRLVGKSTIEDVLDRLFSTFCIGK